MKSLKWRRNLHKTITKLLPQYFNKNSELPQIIIDAIDAAYVQGIEESKANVVKAERKEWREGRRCNICGKPKDSNLTDMCGKCLENN